ncbi:ribokinase [Sphingosinicellaceae bacterium]|nr:ribokinase [Sphingosinicellaceae bacterium]
MRLAAATVSVLGSINLDVVFRVARLPRRGETLSASSMMRNMGGKGANQAVAAARAGATVRMSGAVGDDIEGRMLVQMLQQEGIDCSEIRYVASAPTGTAYIAVDDLGENHIVVSAGANAVGEMEVVTEARVLLAQLETPLASVAAFLSNRRAGSVTVLNAAPFHGDAFALLTLADIVVLNEIELAGYCRERDPPRSPRHAAEMAVTILNGDDQRIVVTLGKAGSVTVDRQGVSFASAGVADVVDTTGAGDCFCGFLAAGMAAERTLATSIADAHRAAAISVGRSGAASSIPFFGELSAARWPVA